MSTSECIRMKANSFFKKINNINLSLTKLINNKKEKKNKCIYAEGEITIKKEIKIIRNLCI